MDRKEQKPIKVSCWGNYIYYNTITTSESDVKHLIVKNAEKTRKEIYSRCAIAGKNAWIEIEELELFDGRNETLSPLSELASCGWRFKGRGRAFFIHSLEKTPDCRPLHKNKSNVPKRKRGKTIL